MKSFLILLIVIALGIALLTTKFNSSNSITDKKLGVESLTTKNVGKILGESVYQLGEDIKQKPQKMVEQTVTNVVNQISSDTASLTNNLINSIISQQFVNSYKNLSPEAKTHVQEAVCK